MHSRQQRTAAAKAGGRRRINRTLALLISVATWLSLAPLAAAHGSPPTGAGWWGYAGSSAVADVAAETLQQGLGVQAARSIAHNLASATSQDVESRIDDILNGSTDASSDETAQTLL